MNAYVVVLILFIILGLVGLFFGLVHNVGSSFKNNQPESSLQSSKTADKQKEHLATIEEQRRAYMESVKQKISDSQNR